MPRAVEGGLAEARALYGGEPSAPLILVEVRSDDFHGAEELLDAVDQLAEVCEPGSNLILLGTANDIDIYRALTRRGVADYLVLPCQPLRIVEAILELYADPAKSPKGQAIAFVGAKGGAGSSTLAHNTAFALTRLTGAEVLVGDLDLPFGAADLSFNVETSTGIRNVLADPDRIDEVFVQRFAARYGDRLHLLAAPALLDADLGIDGRALEMAIEAMKQHMRYVVLDLPHLWTEWVRQTLRQVDMVVVTATADLAGMRNARNLIDFLATNRSLDAPPILVLNRVGALKKGEIGVKDFAQTVASTPAVIVPEDAEAFGLAASHGKMLAEVKPKAKASEAIGHLATLLAKPDLKGPGSPGKSAAGAAAGAGALQALAGRFLRRRGGKT